MHWYLTDEEVMFVRNQLAELRTHMNYVPGKWCLSGLNCKPEVMGLSLPDHMPKKVLLRDISLRTALQVNGVSLTKDERVRLLQALSELGVSSFQISMGWRSRGYTMEQMQEEIKICKRLNPDAEVELGGVATTDGIDELLKMGANCASIQGPANYAISSFYGGGEIESMTWAGKDWRNLAHPPKSLDELVERNKPLIDYANRHGMRIKASLNMLHWADEATIERFAREMGNAGAYYISLQDGPGAMSPRAIAYAVLIAKKAAPNTKIAVHCHNTFGLGIERALTAIQAGAEMVECRINGIDSLGGGTDIQVLAGTLEVMYGVDTGLKLDQFTDLRRLGEDIFRYPVERNHPITGEEYYTYSNSTEVDIDPLIHGTIDPSVFGGKWESHIGSITRNWAMLDKLVELDIPVDKAEAEAINKAARAESTIRKRSLTDDEVRNIAMKIKGNK
ncbi:MAG: hypothetical protein LBQ43_00470 [Holosporales bacterium]|nr:hypothetical protein [Holosporales bacterium]